MRTSPPTFPFVIVLAALAASCRGSSSHSAKVDAVAVGPLGAVDDVDFAPYLTLAHAIVTHSAPPDIHPAPRPGQRVFLTFWSPGHDPVRTTGLGATLLDSVTQASEEAAKTAADTGRVEIDVLTDATADAVSAKMRDSVFAIGTHGYLASGGAGIGFVLPNEILTDKIALADEEEGKNLLLSGDGIRARLAARAHVAPAAVDTMRAARFDVSEHIEGAAVRAPPLALYRSMPPRPTHSSPRELLSSVRAAADYLSRTVDGEGRFLYEYDPTTDASPTVGVYSTLRHAGAVYALLEASEERRVPEWVDAATRAVAYLVAHLQATPDGTFLQDSPDLEQEKVGGAGLALIALTKYQAVTGDTRNAETLRALARLIVHQQYPDGHFRDNADVLREVESERGKKRRKEAFFNTGEAALGLLRLHAVDPNPDWVAAARKAADWVIDVRDAHEDAKHLTPDQWMSYALHDLVVVTGEHRYAAHAFEIGHAIALSETTPLPAPDYAGTFGDEGDTSGSATRLEALASEIEIARFLGDAEDEAWLEPVAMRLACFTRSQQIDADNGYFAKNPARARGGVRTSLIDDDVRVDVPQHAASGWLRFARELRDPSWGKK